MRTQRMALVMVLAAGGSAMAQEAMFTAAATMPSPGTFVLRQQFHVARFGMNADAGIESTTQTEAMTSLAMGLARDWSVRVDLPLAWREDDLVGGGSDADHGVEDLGLTFKWRVFKSDTGGVNTVRVALLGGVAFASGDDHDFSSQSVSPTLGAVVTIVEGRHGFNQEVSLRINPGGDDDHNFGGKGRSDAIFHNSAYLFRIAPAEYASDTVGAWYGVGELLGIYETNGDYELRGSVGVMYEGRVWALEGMVLVPILDAAEHRAELDWGLGVGVRLAF